MTGIENDELLSILLVYPDTREAALGSPGFREVYRTFDEDDSFIADWAWFEKDSAQVLYECREWRGDYDCVALSVSFEMLFANVVKALSALGIEPEREKRSNDSPLVALGGVVPTLNPAPASVIADLVFAGEAEQDAVKEVKRYIASKHTGAANKLTPMSGVRAPEDKLAVPRYYIPKEDILSSYFPGFDDPSICTFSGAGLVEVGRGCSRACRFCAAGHIYLPVRHRPVKDILRDVDTFDGIAERIGLVGASISDHKELDIILKGIIDRGFGLTTSSFRADMVTPDIIALMKEGGLKTLTIAPEGGSARIRAIVNKRLDRDSILRAASVAAEGGIRSIRLYFMVGLPWEREDDIEAIPALCSEIGDAVRPFNVKLTVSLNPFIPKPQTPFQWCPMAGEKYLSAVYKTLKKAFLKQRGISLNTLSIRIAVREAVIGLGGVNTGRAIIDNVLRNIPWKKALTNNSVDVTELLYTFKDRDIIFPWDSVHTEKRKAALYASYEKAYSTAQNT